MTKTKITVHIGVLNLCMAVTTDDDIYSQVTEPEMTVCIWDSKIVHDIWCINFLQKIFLYSQ